MRSLLVSGNGGQFLSKTQGGQAKSERLDAQLVLRLASLAICYAVPLALAHQAASLY
jgi:hypothetical protein